jgi:hypothetical protein
MFFASDSLAGRNLRRINFSSCHFQSTTTRGSSFQDIVFDDCEFERLDIEGSGGLKGCALNDCRVDSLVVLPDEQQSFDPVVINARMTAAGASLGDTSETGQMDFPEDERLKIFERFMRGFLRSTHMDESFIRVRLGKVNSPLFFDEMLPILLQRGVLEEVPWKGQGVQRRYKLSVPMSDISRSLERARGTFEGLLIELSGAD